MKNFPLVRAGTILYGLIIAFFGVNHFMNATAMAGMVPGFIPGGVFWIYLTGTGMILAAIAFIINRYVRVAGILLAVMLIIFVLTIHLPGMINATDEGSKMMSMTMLLKDSAMAAGSLVIAGTAGGAIRNL